MIRSVSLSQITADPRAQSRSGLNHDVVGEYAEAMRAGAVFPPLVVFRDEGTHWLAEGFHRFDAASQAALDDITCDVREGGLRAAVLHSVGANATHGLRRTNEDKRRAVLILLQDEEWSKWSDREIARRCAVDNSFVSRMRSSLLSNNSEAAERTYTTRHGTTATMNTAAIGKRPVAEEVSPDGASTCGVTASAAAPTTQTGTCSAGDGDPLVGRQDAALATVITAVTAGRDQQQSDAGQARAGGDACAEDAGVTAGETATSNVVSLAARQAPIPSFADLDRQTAAEEAADDAQGGAEIDYESAEGRAHKINGSISNIAITDLTGQEYWSVFNRDPARRVYEGWVRDAHAKLSDILKEIDNAQAEHADHAKPHRRSGRSARRDQA